MQTIHRLPRSFRREMWMASLFVILIGLFPLYVLIADWPMDLERAAVLVASAMFLVGISVWTLLYMRDPDRFDVMTTDQWIRVGDAPPISWSQIDELRENGLLRRLDLRGGGRRLASIEYQLTDAASLIDEVRARVGIAPPPPRRRIGMRYFALNVAWTIIVLGALITGCLWVWPSAGKIFRLIVLPFLAWTIISSLRSEMVRLEITDSEIVLRSLFGRRTIPRNAIIDVSTMPWGPARTPMAVVRHRGGTEYVDIAGADGNLIRESLRHFYPELAAKIQ